MRGTAATEADCASSGEGTRPKRHVLGASGQALAAMCLADKPTAEILQAAQRGLKG